VLVLLVAAEEVRSVEAAAAAGLEVGAEVGAVAVAAIVVAAEAKTVAVVAAAVVVVAVVAAAAVEVDTEKRVDWAFVPIVAAEVAADAAVVVA
jgi:hypothetical protein